MELGTCRCARWAAARNVTCGKGRHLAFDEVFFSAGTLAGGQLFGHQETIGGDTQARMMMEAAPTSPLIVSQPQLLLQFQVVALDSPAHVRSTYQIVDGSAFGKRRQPVFARFALIVGPLNEQPLAWPQSRTSHIASSMTHTYRGKACAKLLVGAFSPTDLLPSSGWQRLRQAAHWQRLTPAAAPRGQRRAAASRVALGWQGLYTGGPHAQRRDDANHIG